MVFVHEQNALRRMVEQDSFENLPNAVVIRSNNELVVALLAGGRVVLEALAVMAVWVAQAVRSARVVQTVRAAPLVNLWFVGCGCFQVGRAGIVA